MTGACVSQIVGLDWRGLALPLAVAEDALARLDERLAQSPIRDGWSARTHFSDAAAALGLEGELVHIEDLVLHDAGMDVRTPTHELTRAHAMLRARRRIAAAAPGWALSPAGVDALRGRGGDTMHQGGKGVIDDEASEPLVVAAGDELAELFASVDATILDAGKAIAAERRPGGERDPLVYDRDWHEDARLQEWRAVVEEADTLPPTLAAAIAAEAWGAIEPLQHAPWLGRLLAAALLRQRGKTRSHLACLNEGLKAIPWQRRRSRGQAAGLAVQLEAIAAAAETGLKQHDRWLMARTLLTRKLGGRRSSSRLPALVDYVMSRPIASAAMIGKALGVTPRAAQNMVAELGLREATGRQRYRAWGIL